MMTTLWRQLGTALSLLAALGLAVLVARISLIGMVARVPLLAAGVTPNDPDVVFATALSEYAVHQAKISDPAWRRVQRATAQEPLSADPFLIAAIHAPADANPSEVTMLLEEARRRNPRQRLARVLLLERYAKERRVPELITELATLDRIVTQARPLLINAMAVAAVDPQVADAVFRIVNDPVTLNGLLTKLVANNAPVATIIRFSTKLPATGDADSRVWRQALLDRLVGRGQYDDAYRLWRMFGGTASDPRALVFNGNFTRKAALPPFNWRLATNDVGAAEIGSNHRLSIEYFGRQSGEIAGQLLRLRAGTYRLSLDVEGRVTGDTTKLVWAVRCAVPGKEMRDGPVLLATILSNPTAKKRRLVGQFTVLANGCAAQWLTLDGIAAEFPTSQSIELSNFDLRIVS